MLQQPEPQPCCPRCGGILQVPLNIAYHAQERELVSSNYSITFPGFEAKVVELLWRHRSRGPVSSRMIHDYLYGDDPNGGPDEKVIHVLVCKIRKRLTAVQADVDIETGYSRGYQLKTNKPARRPRAKVAA